MLHNIAAVTSSTPEFVAAVTFDLAEQAMKETKELHNRAQARERNSVLKRAVISLTNHELGNRIDEWRLNMLRESAMSSESSTTAARILDRRSQSEKQKILDKQERAQLDQDPRP